MSENLETIVSDSRLTKDNARFIKKGDLLSLVKISDGKEEVFDRVVLVRNFPFEYTDKYITVLDHSSKELGLIMTLDDLDDECREFIREDIERRYYMPCITRVMRMKEKSGFSSWTVETDKGEVTFSVRDTYKNIIRLQGGRCIITDVDGNRYEIKNVAQLDKKSLKRIELVV